MSNRSGLLSRLIAAAFLVCAGTAAHAEKRVALVIGNSAYQTVAKLPNPVADARLMSDTLLSLGFFVVGGGAQLDLDKDGFDAALKKFGTELIGADVALFYFAGHGVETHGLNYLVPVDAHPADGGDVFMQTVGMASILDQMEKSGTKINLLVLDACRDNPFRDRGVSSTTGGLAQMQAPPGTLISFATQPRSVSFDGDDGHSPYTRALAAVDAASGFWPVQDLQRSRPCRGKSDPWPATAVAVVVADLRQFLFRRQGRERTGPASFAFAGNAGDIEPSVRRNRCAAISSPIAIAWRRCPTTPATRRACPASNR